MSRAKRAKSPNYARTLMSIASRPPKVRCFASQIEDKTLEQSEEIASMPFIFPHVALMPDAHVSMGSAVGAVIGTRGASVLAQSGPRALYCR